MAMPLQTGLTAYRGDTLQPFKPRSGISNWFSGNPELFRQAPKYSPEIQGDVNNLLQQGFQGVQNPYQGFENISNEAVNRFNTQTVPSLAERFTALGGGQRSSAFQSALGGSAADLERSLAALKEGFGQQNRQDMLRQVLVGLANQPEFMREPKQRGWLEGLLGPLLGGGNYQGAMGGQNELAGQLGQSLSGIGGQLLKYLPLLLGI